MSLYPSPEQTEATERLRGLARTLEGLDPFEYQAFCHLNMSNNPDEDRDLLGMGYEFDEEIIHDLYQDLVEHFQESHADVSILLCEEWGIDEDDLPTPEENSQQVTQYSTNRDTDDYEVYISRWKQPNANSSSVDVMHAHIRPQDGDDPAMTLIYVDGEPLDGRKMHQNNAINRFDKLFRHDMSPLLTDEKFYEVKDHIEEEFNAIASAPERRSTSSLEAAFSILLHEHAGLSAAERKTLTDRLEEALDELVTLHAIVSKGDDLIDPNDTMLIKLLVMSIPVRND